ncbi:MAG: bifunctional 4-hydroxy-2-oxoglutarate aldolase/2-dehydro-3-deoxy-phosphogluconate aldolase [Planctomycetaceae bacterium]|nr:bifunctional 4-hydroxy-2-oxoglutarate aldolase/2-dehydro-3-deoxy-phosphogluconate aldolase [Planctomycetaceae bacterium]
MTSPTSGKRSKQQVLDEMHRGGVVAVIRADDSDAIFGTVDALLKGGLRTIEITLTTPGAVELIGQLADRYGRDEMLLGAGTVMEADEASAVIDAGAEFVISPSIELDVIAKCVEKNIVSIPGAYTPTEIRTAVKAGADVVKIFPASVGGPAYLRDLAGPLPGIPLLPSGSVSFETVGEFFKAGVFAVAVGSLLVDKKLMRERKFDAIASKTEQFMKHVANCRAN